MVKKQYKNVGSVLKRKSDGKSYIKLTEDVKAGEFINVDDPRTLPDELFKKGAISEERYEELKVKAASTPDFVLFNLTVAR